MSKEELKQLIQAIYDDYDFAEFNLHFVNEVQPHKVYEIKNNRILNNLKDTTLVAVNSIATNKQIQDLSLYGVDVKDCIIRSMIEETAYKILSDIYKVNSREWVYSQSTPVEVEMTITNWELLEKQTEIGIEYKLRFEVA
jgi:hypothetical protein